MKNILVVSASSDIGCAIVKNYHKVYLFDEYLAREFLLFVKGY